MLAANEFTVGSLEDAKPLTLVLPFSEYGATFLVGSSESVDVAVCLDGQFRYHAFKTVEGDSWKGMLIPDVRIEVDEKSVFDPNMHPAVFGAIICKGSGFAVNARIEGRRGMVWPIILVEGVEAAARASVGFSRWNVVLGSDSAKRILFEISTGDYASADNG